MSEEDLSQVLGLSGQWAPHLLGRHLGLKDPVLHQVHSALQVCAETELDGGC